MKFKRRATQFLALAALTLFSINVLMAEKKHSVTGVINSVDIETKSISIHHDPIESMGMSAMTMDFLVDDVALLNKVKSGQKVRFILGLDDFGQLIIFEIKVVRQ